MAPKHIAPDKSATLTLPENPSQIHPQDSIPMTLDLFPAEVLQMIAWESHNPLFAIVCKTIYMKLEPISRSDFDIMLLCFADCYHRTNIVLPDRNCGWNIHGFEALPWRTSEGKRRSLKLDVASRMALQLEILSLKWLTAAKLISTARIFISSWMETCFPPELFPSISLDNLSQRLADPPGNESIFMQSIPSAGLALRVLLKGCQISEWYSEGGKAFVHSGKTHMLLDTLVIPDKVFENSLGTDGQLLKYLGFCTTRDSRLCSIAGTQHGRLKYSRRVAVTTLRSAIQSDNNALRDAVISLLERHPMHYRAGASRQHRSREEHSWLERLSAVSTSNIPLDTDPSLVDPDRLISPVHNRELALMKLAELAETADSRDDDWSE